MIDPEEFNALRLIREGARAAGDDDVIPRLIGGLHYWHSVASKARRKNTELRATIEHLQGVCRLAVSDGHATPYLTHMIDQAVRSHPGPRRVETAEELEALPYGAIVMLNHREGTEADVLHVSGDGDLQYFGSEIPRSIRGLAAREFPVRVLWIPEGEQ